MWRFMWLDKIWSTSIKNVKIHIKFQPNAIISEAAVVFFLCDTQSEPWRYKSNRLDCYTKKIKRSISRVCAAIIWTKHFRRNQSVFCSGLDKLFGLRRPSRSTAPSEIRHHFLWLSLPKLFQSGSNGSSLRRCLGLESVREDTWAFLLQRCLCVWGSVV